MPFLFSIGTGLVTFFNFISQHPIITKMLIFTTFLAVISYAITFIKSLVAPYLVTNSAFALASYFGILDGLSIYLTIIVAGFGVKQVLAFIRS